MFFLRTLALVPFVLTISAARAQADELPSYDATHCELYVEYFNVAELSYQGTEERALDAQLVVDEAQLTRPPNVKVVRAGAGLGVRVVTAEKGADGHATLTVDERHRIVLAERQFRGVYRVYFPFEHLQVPQSTFEEILDFAFFVDVLRNDGETVRLWQKDRGGAYTIPGVFGTSRGSDVSLGIGVVHYPEPSSVIYDFKRACARN